MTTSDLNTFSGMVEGGNSKPVHITNSASAPIPVSIVGGASFTVIADTEFPAAAPLQDATPNPTTTLVGAMNEVWNGATWDRWPGNTSGGFVQGNIASGVTEAGNPVGIGSVANSSTPGAVTAGQRIKLWLGLSGQGILGLTTSAAAEGQNTFLPISAANNVGNLGVGSSLYNNSNWDRQRNNHEVTVLASAARAVDTNSADQTNYNARGVDVVVDVTAQASTSIVVTIKMKDTLSGKYVTVLASAAIVGASTVKLTVYPGCIAVANAVANLPLARVWRVEITRTGGASDTYSVGANYIL